MSLVFTVSIFVYLISTDTHYLVISPHFNKIHGTYTVVTELNWFQPTCSRCRRLPSSSEKKQTTLAIPGASLPAWLKKPLSWFKHFHIKCFVFFTMRSVNHVSFLPAEVSSCMNFNSSSSPTHAVAERSVLLHQLNIRLSRGYCGT